MADTPIPRTMIKIRPLSKHLEGHWLHWLVYGPPGSAKTTFAGMAARDPRMCDVVHLAIEGGLLTLAGWDWKPGREPHVVEIPDITEMERVFWMIQGRKPPFNNVRTVVIDSGTEFYTKDLEATTARNLPKTSHGGKVRASIDDIWLTDRGESGARVARLFRWFRDLPCHLIVTAHPRYTYPRDDDGASRDDVRPIRVAPAFGPAMLRHVAGYSDFVWAFEQSRGGVAVLTQPRPDGVYMVKTRGEEIAKRLRPIIMWPNGKPLMSALLDTILDGKPIPEWTDPEYKEEKANDG